MFDTGDVADVGGGDLFQAFAAAAAVGVLPAVQGVTLVAVGVLAHPAVNLALEEIAFDQRPQTPPLPPERCKSRTEAIPSHFPAIVEGDQKRGI